MHVRVSDWDVVVDRVFRKFEWLMLDGGEEICDGIMRCVAVVLVKVLYVVRHKRGRSDIHQVGKSLATSEQQT